MKRYLVTGGTGFLGRSLVKALVGRGENVRVFDNDFRGRAETLASVKDRVELVRGDIRDPQAVREACAGIDVVCHLAFVNGTEFFYSKPELVLDVGVKGMANVIDGCRATGVRELFLMSSSEVYQTPPAIPTDESAPLSIPDPLNPRYSYAGGKIISELMAINYGRTGFDRVLIVRPHNVYGPDMGFEHVIPQFVGRMAALKKSAGSQILEFPIQGSGKETRAFVYVDDFTQGVLAVLDSGKHLNIYHVGTQDEISISDLALKIAAQCGVRLAIKPEALTPGSTPRRCPDITKVRALGYRPRVALDEGLGLTVPWYLDRAAQAG